jgi:hypothetical protein
MLLIISFMGVLKEWSSLRVGEMERKASQALATSGKYRIRDTCAYERDTGFAYATGIEVTVDDEGLEDRRFRQP